MGSHLLITETEGDEITDFLKTVLANETVKVQDDAQNYSQTSATMGLVQSESKEFLNENDAADGVS